VRVGVRDRKKGPIRAGSNAVCSRKRWDGQDVVKAAVGQLVRNEAGAGVLPDVLAPAVVADDNHLLLFVVATTAGP
jgi:hypothetical protein